MINKHNHLYYTILIGLFLLLNACEGRFNTIVEVDIPELDDRLVVNCLFNDTTALAVQLFASKGVLVESQDLYNDVADATIELYGDDVLLENLTEQVVMFDPYELGIPIEISMYQSTIIPQQGVTYTLKVSATGYDSVEATALLPKTLEGLSVTVKDSITTIEGNPPDRIALDISFADEIDVENYYFVRCYNQETLDEALFWSTLDSLRNIDADTLEGIKYYVEDYNFGKIRKMCHFTNDVSYQETQTYQNNSTGLEIEGEGENEICYQRIHTFSDRLFENETKNLSIETFTTYGSGIEYYFPNTIESRIIVEVSKVSREMYLYRRSSRDQIQNGDNFFAEPIQVFNNVEGGFGILGGYSIQQVTLP